MHFGYGQDSSEYEDSDTLANFDLQLVGVGASEDLGDLTLKLEADTGNTLDLLGVVAWNGDGLTPFVMFGYTTVELDSEVSLTGSGFTDTDYNGTLSVKDNVTLKGYKLVAGVEGKFSQNLFWHTALEYADYGDEKLTHTYLGASITDKVDLDKTGIRIGMGYRF